MLRLRSGVNCVPVLIRRDLNVRNWNLSVPPPNTPQGAMERNGSSRSVTELFSCGMHLAL